MPCRWQTHWRGSGALHKSHLISLSSEIDAEENLLGLTVSDIQSNVSVVGNSITGTLLYVSGYTGFSGDTSEQSGNYIALHCTAQDGDTITMRLINGIHEDPVTLDADGLVVVRVTNKDTQKLEFVATSTDGTSETQVYDLSGLTLNEE